MISEDGQASSTSRCKNTFYMCEYLFQSSRRGKEIYWEGRGTKRNQFPQKSVCTVPRLVGFALWSTCPTVRKQCGSLMGFNRGQSHTVLNNCLCGLSSSMNMHALIKTYEAYGWTVWCIVWQEFNLVVDVGSDTQTLK